MLTGNTYRKFISDYLLESGKNATARQSFDVVTLTGGDQTGVDVIGLPVISTGTGWELYTTASDISAVTTSTLPDASKVAVIVGPKEGVGHNEALLDLPASGVDVHVVFRDAVLADIDFVTAQGSEVSAAKQAEFVAQLESQRVFAANKATAAQPSYTA